MVVPKVVAVTVEGLGFRFGEKGMGWVGLGKWRVRFSVWRNGWPAFVFVFVFGFGEMWS